MTVEYLLDNPHQILVEEQQGNILNSLERGSPDGEPNHPAPFERVSGISGFGSDLILYTTMDAPLTPREQWRLANFGIPSGIGNFADSRDPDIDGLINFMEYALDGDPLDPSSAPRPQSALVSDKVQLTFNRARAELIYVVEGAFGLSGWAPVATNPGAVSLEVTVPDTVTVSASGKRFLRLNVTE